MLRPISTTLECGGMLSLARAELNEYMVNTPQPIKKADATKTQANCPNNHINIAAVRANEHAKMMPLRRPKAYENLPIGICTTKPAHMAAKMKCEATWLSKPRRATYTGAMVMKPPTKKPAVTLPSKANGTTSHSLGKLMPIFCGNCGCSMRVSMMGTMEAAAKSRTTHTWSRFQSAWQSQARPT